MTSAAVYTLGFGNWRVRWSPQAIHPQNAAWLKEASLQGPGPARAPLGVDNWFWGLLVMNPQVVAMKQDPPVFLTSSTPV